MEIRRQWTIFDILDAHAVLDAQEEADMLAREKK